MDAVAPASRGIPISELVREAEEPALDAALIAVGCARLSAPHQQHTGYQ
jgi:hypothetical protein